MRFVRVTAGLVMMLGVVGCGSGGDSSNAPAMPDVLGSTLDVALSDIQRAGIDAEVEVLGGGALGIIDESNWKVCEQLPAAGDPVSGSPRLTVDRSCPGGTSTTDEATSETTTALSSSETTGVPETSASPADEVLTVENNADLMALLVVPDYCDPTVDEFATAYRGRTIRFDGNIADIGPAGDADTRFNFLVSPGDAGNIVGPAFQFRDVGIIDLGLTGSNIPGTITPGMNVIVEAEVGDYEADQCLLLLDPVSTRMR